MKLAWLPNAITIVRMAMALPLFWLLSQGRFEPAFWLAFAAGASDALDGGLAKYLGWRSRTGALLDPLADKLLLCVAFLGLWLADKLPGWLVALVFARDLIILAGSLTWWQKIGPFEPEPSLLGKFTTLVQILLVLAVLLLVNGWWPLPTQAWPVLAAVVALATLASGLDYVVRYGIRAARELRKKT